MAELAVRARIRQRALIRWRGAVLPLTLLVLWVAIVDSGLVRNALLVPAYRVMSAPFVDADGRQIWAALVVSLLRVVAGLAIGGSLGLAVGVALGLVRSLRRAVSPALHGARQIALFAWIPLLTSWFGNGEAAKLVFISMSAFFPVMLAAEQGVRGVPVAWLEVASALRLRPWRRLRVIVLPAALPAILVGLEIAALTAWIGTVGAEYSIGSGAGVGAFLAAARDVFRMDLVLDGVVLMALVGYVLNRLCKRASRHLQPASANP